MEITYACSRCDQTVQSEFSEATDQLACPHCGDRTLVPADAVEGESVRRCLVCPSRELFVRKNFPQRLGVTIIGLGFLASSVTWYYYLQIATFAILFATALIDVFLYFVLGNLLECYRCHAQYRGLADLEGREGFDLETHERHRQQEARLQEAAKMRS